MQFQFPENFYWGASTSAHQVEGGNTNDWSEWEKKNAERLAIEAEAHYGKLLSWPRIKNEATRTENYISGDAAGHYERFGEDFDAARSLGHNAHRFSIEWSRIEPEEGIFNKEALEHYRRVILALKTRNIEPFVTIWHWTLPLWLRDKGGVQNRAFPKYFRRYAETLIKEYPEVTYWITVNEPEIVSLNAYLRGVWPPQKKNPYLYYKGVWHLIYAHRMAYKRIKELRPEAQIGAALNINYYETSGAISRLMKWFADHLWNFYILNRLWKELDFIGLNHYFHNRINGFHFNRNDNKRVSDIGWELYPQGIEPVLNALKKYRLPVIITENGLADAEDKSRAWFIHETTKSVARAIQDGVDVRGYLHWSLLDNFEWDKGFWPRFGLVAVDYKTQKRTVRQSAEVYSKIIKANSIEI